MTFSHTGRSNRPPARNWPRDLPGSSSGGLRKNGQKNSPAEGRMDGASATMSEAVRMALRGTVDCSGSAQYKCDECREMIMACFNKPMVSSSELVKLLEHQKSHFKKQKHGNGAPTGAFAFTITKSPKDPYSVGDMLTAVRKIVTQKSCPVIKYAWYYEDKGRDENGDPIHPHFHGMYETATGGRIESKHFKRAWPIWDPTKPLGAGFRGGYHRPVKSEEKYGDYIRKDGGMSESFGMEDEETV